LTIFDGHYDVRKLSMRRAGKSDVPRSVWALGFVSMFMDISSEMIHSLLPVFLVSVLGVSVTALGLLEGVSEATVNIIKIFSGALSDWSGKRKPLALAGYGTAALTKPLFPIANSFSTVFAARLLDRTGKGIREAPRDALVADLVPHEIRGASYGLRQSLDTVGAFVGPLSAMVLMLTFKGNFRQVFWIAVIPAFASVAILGLIVEDRPVSLSSGEVRPRPRWSELRNFDRTFWVVVTVGGVFTLARFSEAFLILRANNLGLSNDYVPLVLVVMNVVYAASAYPAGHLSDRIDRRLVLAAGATVLIVADLILAKAAGFVWLAAGISLWGLHMGLTQGLLAASVADAAAPDRRGTAFGLFNLVSGVVLLLASLLAGELWDHFGPQSVFYAGALFAALAVVGIGIEMVRPRR
jgi:MFS family permease